jgi:hypothetical protein
MAKRVPTGAVRPGEQLNQSNIFTDTVAVIGEASVDLQRLVKTKGGKIAVRQSFVVIGLKFEDAGGAAAELAQRLSYSIDESTNQLTIYAEKANINGGAVEWIPSTTTAVTVRWTVLATH